MLPSPDLELLHECLMRVLRRNTLLLRETPRSSSYTTLRSGNQRHCRCSVLALSPSSLSNTSFGALTVCCERYVHGPCSLLHLNLNRFGWSNETPILSFLIPQPLRRKVKELKDVDIQRYPPPPLLPFL